MVATEIKANQAGIGFDCAPQDYSIKEYLIEKEEFSAREDMSALKIELDASPNNTNGVLPELQGVDVDEQIKILRQEKAVLEKQLGTKNENEFFTGKGFSYDLRLVLGKIRSQVTHKPHPEVSRIDSQLQGLEEDKKRIEIERRNSQAHLEEDRKALEKERKEKEARLAEKTEDWALESRERLRYYILENLESPQKIRKLVRIYKENTGEDLGEELRRRGIFGSRDDQSKDQAIELCRRQEVVDVFPKNEPLKIAFRGIEDRKDCSLEESVTLFLENEGKRNVPFEKIEAISRALQQEADFIAENGWPSHSSEKMDRYLAKKTGAKYKLKGPILSAAQWRAFYNLSHENGQISGMEIVRIMSHQDWERVYRKHR